MNLKQIGEQVVLQLANERLEENEEYKRVTARMHALSKELEKLAPSAFVEYANCWSDIVRLSEDNLVELYTSLSEKC